MKSTSDTFKDNIYAPVRRTAGRVTFDISDQTAAGDVSSITTTSESPLSVKAQLVNKVRTPTFKVATNEKDRFKLDGSFSFPDELPQEVTATWTGLVNAVNTGGLLSVAGGTPAVWASGARSVEEVTGSGGYVEYTLTEVNTYKGLALSGVSAGGTFWASYYQMFVTVSATVDIFEAGVQIGTGYTTVITGDKLRISVDGTTVKYSKNGTTFYTSTRPATFPMFADVSLHGATPTATCPAPKLFAKTQINGELGWSSAVICTGDGIFENLLGTDGSCESITPFTKSGSGSTLSVSTTQKRSGTNSIKFVTTGISAYVYKDYTTPLDTDKMYLLAGWLYIESFTAGSSQISLRDVGDTALRYQKVWSTSTGVWKFLYVKVPKNNTLIGSGFRLLFGNTGTGATAVQYFDELRLYNISQEVYDKIDVDPEYTGDTLADKLSYVEIPQTLTFDFTSNHSSAGLTITFDQSTGEYATDFDMTAYDVSNAVIDSVSVVGNTDVVSTPLGQLLNYRKVSVTIKKWSVPNRRARVFEVDFGVVRQYGDDGLINMSLTEEFDMLTSKLPSPELKFTVDNVDRAFNILNPTGFYKYLQQKQQIIAEIGLELPDGSFEYVQLGQYLLHNWQSNEGSITATFTARTNLDSMASFDYEGSYVYNQSLYNYAVAIFGYCGISNYYIDPALQLINTNSLNKKMNCRDILQMIAIAGCANIYVTRDNKITLKCNPTLITTPVDTADFDNMFEEPKITLDEAIKRVEVTYWSNLSTSAIIGVNSTTDTLGDTLKLENNTLINDSTRATAVANWLLAQIKYKARYAINWRGNPAIELNDVMAFENSYGADTSAYITRIELDYGGYLTARMQAKGAVN